jgi:hypothetical protein
MLKNITQSSTECLRRKKRSLSPECELVYIPMYIGLLKHVFCWSWSLISKEKPIVLFERSCHVTELDCHPKLVSWALATHLYLKVLQFLDLYPSLALMAWHSGLRVRLQNRRSRVRIPPGYNVLGKTFQCCCQNFIWIVIVCIWEKIISKFKKS